MKTKCMIVDDEPLAIELLESHLKQFKDFIVVATCSNAIEAFSVLSSGGVDLLFLDIQMPQLSGIDFLKAVKKPPQTIFTTAHREFALESYDLEIIDYLLKPITFNRFFKAIERYIRQQDKSTLLSTVAQPAKTAFITLKSGIKYYKINIAAVLYIESIRDYIRIITLENELTIKYKISDIELELQNQGFIRVHRSFMVNIEKVTAFSPGILEIGQKDIPVGPMYRHSVEAVLK